MSVCIDTRPDLDATARAKPTLPVKIRAPRGISLRRATPIPGLEAPELPGLSASGTEMPDETLPLDVRNALAAITEGEGGHAALVALAGKLAAQGVPESTAIALLTYAADQRPPERRDAGWKKLRADIGRTVSWANEREAETSHSGNGAVAPGGNGATPPPPPPPGAGPGGAVPPPPQPQPTASAARGMMRSRNPRYAGNLANVITCLLERAELAGCVAFDRMASGVSLRRALPGTPALPAPRPWTDDDTSRLQDFLQGDCQMARVGKETVQQGVEHVAQMVGFHPVQQYLDALAWDGTGRAGTWLTTYLGVDDSEYARATGRMWLTGMVARVYRPGCKFDYAMILEGLQGTLKSQVCVALCGPWVSDQSLDIRHDARAASQHLRNKWLVEISELTFFRQADVETLKAFITRTHERYLPRYAHNEVVEPRQCGFVGTTNQDVYLHDPTGNRRFWPHRTSKIDVRALMRDRDQLWAEIAAAYRAGEHWWPEEAFEARVIKPEQAARYDADAWTPLVETYLNGKSQVTLIDVFRRALADPYDANHPELPPERFDRKAQIRVREILQNLGWRRGQRTLAGRWWIKPP